MGACMGDGNQKMERDRMILTHSQGDLNMTDTNLTPQDLMRPALPSTGLPERAFEV